MGNFYKSHTATITTISQPIDVLIGEKLQKSCTSIDVVNTGRVGVYFQRGPATSQDGQIPPSLKHNIAGEKLNEIEFIAGSPVKITIIQNT